jgi:hypothetical protein
MSKQERWAIVAVLILIIILFGVLLTMFITPVAGQDCYPGFSPTPDDPDCDGIISIGTPLSVTTTQGANGLYYMQCLSGCAEFYEVAPIDVLYQGYATSFEAIETFVQLQYAYHGWGVYTPPQG